HPGNLAAQAGNRIVFFDFGIIGHLTEETRERIGSLLIALVGRDIEGIMEAFIDLSLAQSTINRSLLRRDIDRMLFKYYEIPLADLNLGEILDDVMILAKKHNLQMPSEFALMAKALLTLEGVDRELDPDLSIMKIAEPLTRKLLTDRYGPRQIIRHAFRHAHEYGRIFKALPSLINDVLTGVKSGELPVNLQVRHDYTQNQELLRKVSTMVNRLAMSIIIASLIMGSALLSQGNNFFLRQFPIAEAVFLLAGVMAAALFVSIFRSGRF
ncbi:MAG: AarF/UbiB family protein, partial [bacterium]|nr:AarF/UbiB family protein [bacterium]